MRRWLRGLPVLAMDPEWCPRGLRRCAEALLPVAGPDVPSAPGQSRTVATTGRDSPILGSKSMHARKAERPRPRYLPGATPTAAEGIAGQGLLHSS